MFEAILAVFNKTNMLAKMSHTRFSLIIRSTPLYYAEFEVCV